VRNFPIVEEFEQWCEGEGAIRYGLANDYRSVYTDECIVSFLGKFDRAGTVKKCEADVFVFSARGVHFCAHLAIARFRRTITYCIAILGITFASNCPCH